MKQFLIVTTSLSELNRYYNFIVETLADMIHLCYCGKNHGRVETKDFCIEIIVENYYPIHAKKIDSYIYTGYDREYEALLKPLIIANK